MTYTKSIVCLANSIKHHPKRCIAGKELAAQNLWIRPVSNNVLDEGALSQMDSAFQNGAQPKLLDVIEVHLKQTIPHGCQTENHLIDETAYWQKTGKIDWATLESLLDMPQSLWVNGNSTKNGFNDKISQQVALNLPNSLKLIRPENFQITVTQEGGGQYPVKRAMRAKFQWNNVDYLLKITDPNYTNRINEYTINVGYTISNAIICISISDILKEANAHFKLIASIITTDMT